MKALAGRGGFGVVDDGERDCDLTLGMVVDERAMTFGVEMRC